MKVPMPSNSCQRVSELAARKARENVRSMGWSNKTIEALVPLPEKVGEVGIQTKLKYLMYQERGIRSFLMEWVRGRTVPIGGKGGGKPNFRFGSHVGEPGYVNLPGIGRVWRDQRWRHPGLKPKHFMQQAIEEAIKEAHPEIRADVMKILRGEGNRPQL